MTKTTNHRTREAQTQLEISSGGKPLVAARSGRSSRGRRTKMVRVDEIPSAYGPE
jgi:hypothetical protein